jgi:hypothetical protein
MAELRHELVGDSMTRARQMAKLVALIRADERARTIEALGHARDRATVEPR